MTVQKCDGELSLVRTEINSYDHVEVTENGDITLGENYSEEVLDVLETSIWCDKCKKLGSDEYEAHGISEDWQEV